MLSKSVGPLTRQTFFSFTGLPDAIGEVQSIQRTRPSWSYSTNVGRIGAMSLAMSIGNLVVVMMMTGMPFFRPSAMKFRRATSFPTKAGPTNRTFELALAAHVPHARRASLPRLVFQFEGLQLHFRLALLDLLRLLEEVPVLLVQPFDLGLEVRLHLVELPFPGIEIFFLPAGVRLVRSRGRLL